MRPPSSSYASAPARECLGSFLGVYDGYPVGSAWVALRDLFQCLDKGADQFFYALGTARQEQQRAQSEKIKSDLIAYRLSLNWSLLQGGRATR